MKVLIVSTSERQGGAAIAARRLMEALEMQGQEVRMLVRDRQTDDGRVHAIACGKWGKAWEHLRILAANGWDARSAWKLSLGCTGVDITETEEFRWADVVHLHWVNQGFVSLKGLHAILLSGKPVVWTMHDQWPFTGVCHLLQGCTAYRRQCMECPQLRARDLAHSTFLQKMRTYAAGHIAFVGCSRWITELAGESLLTAGQHLLSIPNAVPQDVFHPIPMERARRELELPGKEMRLVMFQACRRRDVLKGFHPLAETLALLPRNGERIGLIVVGAQNEVPTPLPTFCFPYVSDPHQMALLYAAADVFLSASYQENLPNTIAEAMSCGTPCCAFAVGGIPEMIVHGVDGYMAPPMDARELAAGILFCLQHDMRTQALLSARNHYSPETVAQAHIALYDSIRDLSGSKFKVQSSRFKVQGSRFKVQGSKFKVDLRSSSVATRPNESKLSTALAAPDVQGSEVQIEHLPFTAATLEKVGPGMPLFSVCTVCYNAQDTIQPTLDSVAGQDFPWVEHLIVDGASNDGTLSILRQYEQKARAQGAGHLVSVLSEPDTGLYDAMNKALLRARGLYLVFLNAGDRLHGQSTLSQMASQLGFQNATRQAGDHTSLPEAQEIPAYKSLPAVLYGETDLVDSSGRFLRHRRLGCPEHLTWRSFRSGMLVCHQSFYVLTALARYQAYDLRYRFSADFDWCVRILRLAEKDGLPVHNTHLVLTDYLSEGMTTKNHRRSLLERFRIMARHYGLLSTLASHCWFVVRGVIKK